MKVQYMKGVATHHGPESCVPVREDRRLELLNSGIEALTGEDAGQVLSPDIRNPGLLTLCANAEGKIEWRENRKCRSEPAGSETLCMRGSFMRENREISSSLAGNGSASRVGKAKAVTP